MHDSQILDPQIQDPKIPDSQIPDSQISGGTRMGFDLSDREILCANGVASIGFVLCAADENSDEQGTTCWHLDLFPEAKYTKLCGTTHAA